MALDEKILRKYQAVIGLEVHAQLLTRTKIFSPDTNHYGEAPNTQISVVSLAHPGTLPRLNGKAVELAVRMGLACQSSIARHMIFDRKNYFYPDLPKGYQLTQDRTPVCVGGFVRIVNKQGLEKKIPLNRIHLEEDAGKSMHLDGEVDTLVDFNRAGVTLIEIVTEPAIHASDEAYAFLTEVRKLVRHLDICDGNMEEGSMRCDANVSVRLMGTEALGKKVEVKNMNSIRNVQRAIDHEIVRQIECIERGEQVISETRTFDADTGITYGMRTKEELNDYRYFPDPDISPVTISDTWLESIRASMPALPWELQEKFEKVYGLPSYDAQLLSESKETARYFEQLCAHTQLYKAASNWMMGPVRSYLNEKGLAADQLPVKPATLAELIQLVDAGMISFTVATQRVFPALPDHPDKRAQEVAALLNAIQDRDEDSIQRVIEQIMVEFPLKVEEYKKGKKGILAMFMGEVMKRTQGKADPRIATDILNKKLQDA
jgi:aspartyl-tRNA(Asn)/glutamyl-tRNA(Gln) amidotransferase subunit B